MEITKLCSASIMSFKMTKVSTKRSMQNYFSILVKRWSAWVMVGAACSLLAMSLKTGLWMAGKRERVPQASGFDTGSFHHKLMCSGHSTGESCFCFLYFLPMLLGKSLDRPEERTMHHENKKGSGLLYLMFPLPGLIFQTKPLCTWPTWASGLI